MKKIITKKNIYLLFLLVISLLGLAIIPTYAKFPSNYITDNDVVGMLLDFNIGLTSIEEYEEITVPAGGSEQFNINIENISSNTMYYGIWYRPKDKNTDFEDVVIGRILTTETSTTGAIDAEGTTTVSIGIINYSSTDVTLNIGVASSTISTNSIEYLNNKELITGTVKITKHNKPNINNGNLIPVYYDETNEVWKKADSSNKNNSWYDYDEKKWANAIVKDNNTVIDLSNNLNNGTIFGAVWDKTNKTVTTDGSNDYVNFGLANHNFGSDLSFVVRFKFDKLPSSSTNAHIVGNWEGGGGGLYLSVDNKLKFELYVAGAYKTYTSSLSITAGTWYTVAATFNGSKMILYSNGTSIGSLSASGSVGVSKAPIAMATNPAADNTFTGNTALTMSDFLIFDRALTSTEISSDYANVPKPSNKTSLLGYYDFSDNDDIPIGTIISDSGSKGTFGFYTWIPRYKYHVWNITRVAGAESTYAYSAYTKGIDIEWEKGTDSTGNVECTYNISTAESTSNLSDTCVYNKTDTITTSSSNANYTDAWYTHPAFTFGDRELEGFWMGKFETSGSADYPKVLPDVAALKSQTISAQFTTSKKFQEYILSNNIDAHMLTNLEWGAVAYLTHSKYGLCTTSGCRDVYMNNSTGYYTGRSGGAIAGSDNLHLGVVYPSNSTATTHSSTTGYYNYKGYFYNYSGTLTTTKDVSKVASTTGNITGVYDMSGGSYEYVMANMATSAGAFNPLSAETNWNGLSALASKYYNAYSYGTLNTGQAAMNRTRLGDATAEVMLKHATSGSWRPSITNGYSASNFIYNTDSQGWMGRGGYVASEASGLFGFSKQTGASNGGYSFRLALS